MKAALDGRVVFGASAVLFGVIALMWHDADAWQNLQHIWSLPFGTVIGGCLMIAQLAGGIGVVYPRTARLASIRSGDMCGAAMAVGVSSSQSLRVQVGARYRDQDPGRASSLEDAYWPRG